MNGLQVYGLGLIALGVAVWCGWYLRASFRRGWIAYGGNTRSTMKTQRYYRSETALGFYGGVLVYSLTGAIALGVGASAVIRHLF